MRTIIVGGRAYRLTKDDWIWLEVFETVIPISKVLSRGELGVDTDVAEWARARTLPVEIFSAEWKRYGGKAGPMRNQRMVDKAKAVIAFPGDRWVEDIVQRALTADSVRHVYTPHKRG